MRFLIFLIFIINLAFADNIDFFNKNLDFHYTDAKKVFEKEFKSDYRYARSLVYPLYYLGNSLERDSINYTEVLRYIKRVNKEIKIFHKRTHNRYKNNATMLGLQKIIDSNLYLNIATQYIDDSCKDDRRCLRVLQKFETDSLFREHSKLKLKKEKLVKKIESKKYLATFKMISCDTSYRQLTQEKITETEKCLASKIEQLATVDEKYEFQKLNSSRYSRFQKDIEKVKNQLSKKIQELEDIQFEQTMSYVYKGMGVFAVIMFIIFSNISNKKRKEREEAERLALLEKCPNCNEPLDAQNNSFSIELSKTEIENILDYKEYEFYKSKDKITETYTTTCHRCNHAFVEKKQKENYKKQVVKCPSCQSFNTEFNEEMINQSFKFVTKAGKPNARYKYENNPMSYNLRYKCHCFECNNSWYSDKIEAKVGIASSEFYEQCKR